MTIDLRHGDCLDIMPTIPDASVDMVLTDLPYGTTQNKWDSEIPLEPLWREWRRVIRDGSAVVLFGQQPFTSKLGASNLPWLRYEWIYEKSHPTGFLNANRAPLKNHENILVFCERGTPYNPQMSATRRMAHPGNAKKCVSYGEYDPSVPVRNPGLTFPRTILDYPEWNGRTHPTQKPVGLCEFLIRTYTDPGMTVLDCCMGSGTTGVACVRTGRSFIGIEMDDNYFQQASERINGAEEVESELARNQRTLMSFGGDAE